MLITDIYLQHYGDASYVREASKHMSCGLEVKQFFYFLVSSADLDILCSESFSHHVNYLMVAHKISNEMGCVNLNSSTIDELGEGAWKDGGASSTGAERVG